MSVNHLGSEPVALETGRVFDQPRAEAAVRELLIAIGENPDRPGLRDTPARVARSYREVFAGLYTDPDTVLNTTFDEGHQELVLVRDIPLYSTCEHHLVSFHGVAHVGYIPGKTGKVTGLSKLARVVDLYAKRPQVQERLTSQIADARHAQARPARCDRGHRGRAPVHGDAGDPQAWCEYHHLRGAWSAPVQRGLTFRGSGPYSAEVTVIELPAPGRTVVMGVLNVTTDSFSDGGRFLDRDAALARGLELKRLGVDIVDVGGESTRPGAARVDPDVEAGRVAPVIADLVGEGICVSVDTMRASVAEAAIEAGASIINDVAGGRADAAMASVVADAGVPWILMHWRSAADYVHRGTADHYDDVVRRSGTN